MSAPTINLAGPSTSPGAPQITPAAINTQVNTALQQLYASGAQFDATGSLEVPGPTFTLNNGSFAISIATNGQATVTVNLPDVDPHSPGVLWNNAGLIAISAG